MREGVKEDNGTKTRATVRGGKERREKKSCIIFFKEKKLEVGIVHQRVKSRYQHERKGGPDA